MAEVEEWVGRRVDDVNGSMIGRVEAIRADHEGRPLWLIVSEFHFGEGRRFAVPAADAVGCPDRVWSPYPRELITATSAYAGNWIGPEVDHRLIGHYLGPSALGRAA